MTTPHARDTTKTPPEPKEPVRDSSGGRGESRLLGEVSRASRTVSRATADLERLVVKAWRGGCSTRQIAKAAGYGSHTTVTQLLTRLNINQRAPREH